MAPSIEGAPSCIVIQKVLKVGTILQYSLHKCGVTDPRASQNIPKSQNEAPRALLAPPQVDGWVMNFISYQLYYYCLPHCMMFHILYRAIQITNSQYIFHYYHIHVISISSTFIYYYNMLAICDGHIDLA